MIPVLAGIPWLASLLGGLFSSLFVWFATVLTKRLAIVAAAIIVLGAVTVGFFAALQTLISGLGLVLPAEVLQGASHILPANTSACVTAMLTARTARYAYDWNIKIIQLKLL